MKTLLSLLALSSTSGASHPQDHAALHGQSPGEAVFDASAPPELGVTRNKTGLLLVRPILNGHEPGWFIFDSGAAICVVSTPLADSLGLAAAGEVPSGGVGGHGSAAALRAATLVLGPLTLRDVPLMKTDLTFLKGPLGVEVAGVIGYGVLSRCIVELDLAAPRIALHDPRGYELAQGEWSPLELDELIPTVVATCEGRRGRFHLDLGSNGGLTFQEPAVRRYNLLEGREMSDVKLAGVGGSVACKQGRVAWLELANVRLTDLEAIFPVEAKGLAAQDGRDGSIGTKVLESFVLTLDYPGSRICFRPRGG
jgi:hypothetical protein